MDLSEPESDGQIAKARQVRTARKPEGVLFLPHGNDGKYSVSIVLHPLSVAERTGDRPTSTAAATIRGGVDAPVLKSFSCVAERSISHYDSAVKISGIRALEMAIDCNDLPIELSRCDIRPSRFRSLPRPSRDHDSLRVRTRSLIPSFCLVRADTVWIEIIDMRGDSVVTGWVLEATDRILLTLHGLVIKDGLDEDGEWVRGSVPTLTLERCSALSSELVVEALSFDRVRIDESARLVASRVAGFLVDGAHVYGVFGLPRELLIRAEGGSVDVKIDIFNSRQRSAQILRIYSAQIDAHLFNATTATTIERDLSPGARVYCDGFAGVLLPYLRVRFQTAL